MKIEKTSFGRWNDAWRLENNGAELIIVIEIGPRILSLRINGGKNLLFVDETLEMKRGDWHLCGGHRFWLAPEDERSYTPDNAPATVKIEGETLTATAGIDANGLQKVMEISAGGPSGFTVRHILRNTGTMLSTGALWTLTCVVPKPWLLVPWGEGSASWRTHMVRYWSAWAGHDSNVASSQWKQTNETFGVNPSGEEGKAGLFSDQGVVAQVSSDGTFIKWVQPVAEAAAYPDGGCNIELYTCPAFNEMETLSPFMTFYPGKDYVHTEQWIVSGKTFAPEDWPGIKALLPTA